MSSGRTQRAEELAATDLVNRSQRLGRLLALAARSRPVNLQHTAQARWVPGKRVCLRLLRLKRRRDLQHADAATKWQRTMRAFARPHARDSHQVVCKLVPRRALFSRIQQRVQHCENPGMLSKRADLTLSTRGLFLHFTPRTQHSFTAAARCGAERSTPSTTALENAAFWDQM